MADYFTQCSFTLPMTEEQAVGAKALHDACLALDASPGADPLAQLAKSYSPEVVSAFQSVDSFESDSVVELFGPGLGVYAPEQANLEFLGHWMQAVMRWYKIPDYWVFTYSSTCNKIRPDAFTGGVVHVTQTSVEIVDALSAFWQT